MNKIPLTKKQPVRSFAIYKKYIPATPGSNTKCSALAQKPWKLKLKVKTEKQTAEKIPVEVFKSFFPNKNIKNAVPKLTNTKDK